MANSPKDFQLSKEENKAYFDKNILPAMKMQYSFKTQEKPTAFFTAGLPGAGKSKILDRWEKQYQDIIIIDADNLRKEHPNSKEILELFGEKSSEVTHADAVKWVALTKAEAIKHQANYILDSSMRHPRSAEIEIGQALSNGYDVKVTMVAVNEYESLQGVFNRYAYQYEKNSKEARFVDPSFVKNSSLSILDSAAVIENMNIKEFKIVSRDMDILFDSNAPEKDNSAKEILSKHIDIRNWDKEKVSNLKHSWDVVINKLENIKAPSKVIESAKSTKNDLLEHLKQISQTKFKIVNHAHSQREATEKPFTKQVKTSVIKQQTEIPTHDEAKRNKILEQLKKQTERSKQIGKER